MKRWIIVIISIVVGIAAVILFGSMIYNNVIAPKYIAPVVEDVSQYLQNDDVVTSLYDEATRLHDDGTMTDETYAKFIRAYNEHFRNNEDYAKEILETRNNDTNINNESSAINAAYNSQRVGMEVAQVNEDGQIHGKAETTYSSERTSNRIKAEDYVEAEKIVEEAEGELTPAPTKSAEQSAYDKLKKNMTGEEYSTFTKIMSKLSIGELKKNISSKDALKEYLHSRLNDEVYKSIVNLGYKYVYIFLAKE